MNATQDRTGWGLGALLAGTLMVGTTLTGVTGVYQLPDGLLLEGDRIFFLSDRDGTTGVYSIPSQGGQPTLIGRSSEFNPLPWSISGDGQTLFVSALTTSPSIKVRIATLPTTGGDLRMLLEGRDDTYASPGISRDEEWLLGYAGPLAEPRVQIWPYPAVEQGQIPVSDPSAFRSGVRFEIGPAWSADGSEIFFVSDLTLWAARVEYEPTLLILPPEPVLRGRYQYGATGENGLGGRAWDVDPNGERFLMIVPPPIQINVVKNWTQELLERVPVD